MRFAFHRFTQLPGHDFRVLQEGVLFGHGQEFLIKNIQLAKHLFLRLFSEALLLVVFFVPDLDEDGDGHWFPVRLDF